PLYLFGMQRALPEGQPLVVGCAPGRHMIRSGPHVFPERSCSSPVTPYSGLSSRLPESSLLLQPDTGPSARSANANPRGRAVVLTMVVNAPRTMWARARPPPSRTVRAAKNDAAGALGRDRWRRHEAEVAPSDPLRPLAELVSRERGGDVVTLGFGT